MLRLTMSIVLLGSMTLISAKSGRAQFLTVETPDMSLVYTGRLQEYLVPQIVRSFENALQFNQELFNYTPTGRIRVLVHDLWHYGNAGARPVPHNNITIGIAPYAMLYDTSPGNERLNSSLNHEMIHVVTTDKASRSDRFFRSVFQGKVQLTAEQPATLLYSYLTTPRWYTPRWYLEGIAVYMETWMNGGLGRAIGAYDEMVFRTMARDSAYMYDVVGLESEGTTIDFHVGINAYLYGTRFVSFLGYRYGNEKLLAWYDRTDGTSRYFTNQFRQVYGRPISEVWAEWIRWERDWQRQNLARIREHPVTQARPFASRALGSVSRAHLDSDRGVMYVAVQYPGQIAHLASLDVATGRIQKLQEVIGAAGMNVTSLAYDADGRTLFYTTDNNNWVNLVAFDLERGRSRTVQRQVRTGDLVFNSGDRSLWGVRHFNGISTIVRIPPPYDEWNQIHSLPYGRDVFDLDVSPDGQWLVASASEISGKQRLIRLNIPALLAGDYEEEELFDFGNWAPGNFVYSADGRYLFGTSYYSGVSNVFRYDFERSAMEPISNAEAGFFRPLPYTADSLIVFQYTGMGLVPSFIPVEVPGRVSAVRFLGNEIVREQPVVKSWAVGSPRRISVDSLVTSRGTYRPVRNLRLDSIYPIVEGYKDYAAVGLRANFSDQIMFNSLTLSAAYTPTSSLETEERFHGSLDYNYLNLGITASYNGTDFYDLFGPTKTSRKGYSLGVRYGGLLHYDHPRRVEYSIRAAGYGGLETLPEFQNVVAPFSELLSAESSVSYSFIRSSLGAVEAEQGTRAGLTVQGNYVREEVFPRVRAEIERGLLLPLDHSSIWLRGAAGQSLAADLDNPFGLFFFGAFGNNWVDHGTVKRFRSYDSFPGVDINEVGGANFGRVQLEWVLPPLRFRRAGIPSMYLRWASLSVFGTALVTDVDRDDLRRTLANVGTQLDVRLVSLSHLNSTISVGYATAFERETKTKGEFMLSIKIM